MIFEMLKNNALKISRKVNIQVRYKSLWLEVIKKIINFPLYLVLNMYYFVALSSKNNENALKNTSSSTLCPLNSIYSSYDG